MVLGALEPGSREALGRCWANVDVRPQHCSPFRGRLGTSRTITGPLRPRNGACADRDGGASGPQGPKLRCSDAGG
jgi:hypothetical protein